ncbi:MAG TPA: hypothetical protein VGH19_11930 [Verrucomicrobiae bacterium]
MSDEANRKNVVEYVFHFADGSQRQFKVFLNRTSTSEARTAAHPFWTALEFNQCVQCPLQDNGRNHCPPAVDLEEVIEVFKNVVSHEMVTVQVITGDRFYAKQCDVQTGLRALVALIMSTSGCPVLNRLRGLAKMHLPFASMQETTFRLVGAYLLRQYFIAQEGGKPDWKLGDLSQYMNELQEVNRTFKRRLDAAAQEDASLNVLGTLVYVAMGVADSIEYRLNDLKEVQLFGMEE